MVRRSPPLPSAPDTAPFHASPWPLGMHLAVLDLHHWIAPDDQFVSELQEKAGLLHKRHQDVFAALPGAAAGAAEVLALLAEHLPVRFPLLYRRAGPCLDNLQTGERWNLATSTLHPLDLAGRLVQEDLCLLQQAAGTDTYHLVGGSVCFPTRWRLADKLGQPLAAIHAPVPGYAAHLATSMDQLFLRLKVVRPLWRRNWSLIDDPALFQPGGHGAQQRNPHITAHNAGDRVWLRIERQTLRRLPRTHDILFTIRVYVHPLHVLAAHPEDAAALAASIRAMPPVLRQYKSFPPFQEAVLTWLEQVVTTAGKDMQG